MNPASAQKLHANGGNVFSDNRNRYLDVLRGIAILCVIAVHSGAGVNALITQAGGAGVPPLILGITDLGRFGVQLFFLLSGWLLQDLYGDNGKHFQGKKFLVRRLARIVPLWLVFLALGFVLPSIGMQTGISQLLSGTHHDGRMLTAGLIVLLALTFTLWVIPSFWNTVISGGWSIQAEVGHYLAFPLLRKLSVTGLILMLALLRLATGVLYFAGQTAPNSLFTQVISAWTRLGLFNSLIFFVGGMLISRWKSGDWLTTRNNTMALILFWGSLLLNADGYGEELQKFGFIGVALTIAAVVSRWRFIEMSLASIGKYSYFIYFCHFLGLQLASELIVKTDLFKITEASAGLSCILVPMFFLFALGFSFTLALASWRFFENPIIRLSRKK